MSDEEGPALGDLMSVLAGDLRTVIARTLADRSAEPARLFAAHVAATDRRVAAEATLPEDRHETLGVTVGCLILAEWLAGAPAHDDMDRAGVMGSVHADLGPDCADRAAALLDGPAPPVDGNLLVALIWLAAAMVRHYGDDDVAWLWGNPADAW